MFFLGTVGTEVGHRADEGLRPAQIKFEVTVVLDTATNFVSRTEQGLVDSRAVRH